MSDDGSGGLRHEGRRIAEAALAHSPLQWGFSRAARGRLCVIAYHGVPDRERFAAHLEWLAGHTTPVSLAEAMDLVGGAAVASDRPVLLTFDDGDRTVLDVAAPLLRDRGIPAVAFLVAGLIDTTAPFWWVEVEELVRRGASTGTHQGTPQPTGGAVGTGRALVRRMKVMPNDERLRVLERLREQVAEPVEMAQLTSDDVRRLEQHGVAVGNHSLTHPCLDRCDDDTLARELRDSHARLSSVLGHEPTVFAYPNGNHDRRVQSAVADAGYELAFAFDHRLVRPPVNPLAVSRVMLDSWASRDVLRIRTSGLHPALVEVRK